jgi:hypothetical protein
MKIAMDEQNANKQGKLLRRVHRQNLGRLKGFKCIPRKKPCFWAVYRCFSIIERLLNNIF